MEMKITPRIFKVISILWTIEAVLLLLVFLPVFQIAIYESQGLQNRDFFSSSRFTLCLSLLFLLTVSLGIFIFYFSRAVRSKFLSKVRTTLAVTTIVLIIVMLFHRRIGFDLALRVHLLIFMALQMVMWRTQEQHLRGEG